MGSMVSMSKGGVNDAELLLLARVLKCGVADLYPKRPGNLERVLRHGQGRGLSECGRIELPGAR
jgi:hypothetical protein